MTAKEATLAAIEHRETGVVPYHIDVLAPVRLRLSRHYGTDNIDRAMGNCLRWMNLKFDWTPCGDGLKRDEFGVIWAVNELNRGYIHEHPLPEPNLEGYTFPVHDYDAESAHFGATVRDEGDYFLATWIGDLFERANFLRGLDQILMDMLIHREFVDELFGRLAAIIHSNIDAICRYDVDGLFLSDDYGLQSGLMMRPATWREIIKPHVREIFAHVHDKGKKALLHSCGNVTEIVPDLIDAGLDVLHPVQPEATDMRFIKKEYGDALCLYGGVSTQRTLAHGSPAEVRDETRAVVETMSAGGGFILAPGITLQHDISDENLFAFIDACRRCSGMCGDDACSES